MMTEQTSGLPRVRIRAAQRELTRSRFVDAAVAVFAERGYPRTTVDEICERAGATRTTFYLHFKAKSDLLLELMDRGEGHFHAVYRDLSDVAHDPTLDGVRRWLSTAMQEWKVVADLSRPILEAAVIEPEVGEILRKRNASQVDELAAALRQGARLLSARDAEVYASILLAPLRYYFELYVRGEKFDRPRVLDAMASAWMAVIGGTQSDASM
ncbi:MAG: regulatory protein TetR [Frankiales bacterium]|nr:regulatory protein TetR [Frankiales bacterium]